LCYGQILSVTYDDAGEEGSEAVGGTGTMSVSYLVDGTQEKDVSLARLKLTRHGRDAVNGGLLSYISEVKDLIGGISTQPGFRHMVNGAIDIALVKQMVDNNAFDIQELLNLTTTIVALISDLQSPARKVEYQEWFGSFVARCKQCSSLSDALKLLPMFFEMATSRIEELQIEVTDVL
jgi:hypothetical protein